MPDWSPYTRPAISETSPIGKPPTGEPYAGKPHVRLCVQLRLACSAGDSPAGVEVRSPVVRIAEGMETEPSKPIDKVSVREITSHRAVSTENALWPRKCECPRAEPATVG